MVFSLRSTARRVGVGAFSKALAAVATLFAVTAFSATVNYAYDESGRLVQVQSSTSSAQYQYDIAGNLTTVIQSASTAVQIADFSPNAAPVGTTVTITGVGFSTTPSANAVTFNGIAATVMSASANSVVVTVPTGATTGKINITVAGVSSASPSNFSVVATASDAPITVASAGSQLASASGSITLTGTNFAGSGADLWVRVNGQLATITSSSSTQLVFTVPVGATSGAIEVGSRNGVITNADSLFVTPAGISSANIAPFTSLTIDGAPYATSIPASKQGIFTFDGLRNQSLGLGISALSTTPSGGNVSITVYSPDASVLVSCPAADASGNSCDLPPLPSDGTYTMLVTPSSSSAAAFTLTLSSDVAGTLSANALPLTFKTTRIGQNGLYSFNAIAGSNFSIDWSASTLAGSWSTITVYQPDGIQLTSATFDNGASGYAYGKIDLRDLPLDGQYLVRVSPFGSSTGQVNIGLNAVGSLQINGPATAVMLSAGQNGYYTFDGQAGQYLGLGVSALSTTPTGGAVTVTVLGVDGTTLTTCLSGVVAPNSCNFKLPSNATYTVVVTQAALLPTNLTLTLSSDVSGVLTANAAATSFSTTRVGQNARYTFNATAGQNANLVWNGSTFAGYWSYITLYNPDGTTLTSQYFGDSTSGGASGNIALSNLQQTGTYTAFVDPYAASTGTVNVQLLSDAPGALAVDGAALPVTLQSGQRGDFTFSGTAGQHLGLGISALSTSPSGSSVAVSLIAPDNVTMLTMPCSMGGTGGSCNLPTLPSTGTYTVRITPASTASATLTLTLSSDVSASLTANAAATQFSTARVGQNARYTFSATVGQNVSLLWSGSTFAGTWSYIRVYNPDGTQLNSQYFADAASGVSSGVIALTNLQQSGNYTVFVDPYLTSTGAVSLQYQADAPGSLAVDGAALPVTLQTGQIGDVTFSGTAGQHLGLGVSALSTSPSGGSVTVALIAPDNVTALTASCSLTTSGGSCNLPALPSTGTYTVRITPASTSSANMTLTLSSDQAGTLTANAAATQFSTARVGQNARYTFNATAGQNASLVWSGSTFTGTWSYIRIYNPDGSALNSQYFADAASGWSAGVLTLNNLQQSGSYTVVIDPYLTSTGAVSLQLESDAPGTLAVDGASLPVTLQSGQRGDFTFSGTVGQHLGLGVSALSTSPSGGLITVSLIAPDNVTALTMPCSLVSTGGSCNLPALPSTGTYTVRVTPPTTSSASMTLTLSSDLTGTMTANAAATPFNTARVGQNARYTFSATAGQDASLAWSGTTMVGAYSYVTIYNPDGTTLMGQPIDSVNYPGGTMLLNNLLQSGTYTVFVDPFQASTGAVNLQYLANAPATLAVDGAILPVALKSGQRGDIAFNGTVGQHLGLGISGLSTSPTGGNVSVSLIAPDNMTTLTASCTLTTSGGSCNLPVLPSTGTYTVRVTPPSTSSANMNLTLSSDSTGTLTANAAATQFNTSRVGQNARYTFSATAGQNASLVWSGATFVGNWSYITIYNPDGTTLANQYIDNASYPSGTMLLNNLQQSGTYTVFVDPYLADTGSVSVQYQSDAPGTLAVDGAALPVTLLSGQRADIAFSGTVGQRLGLGVSALSTSPVGGSITVSLIAPDNVTALSTPCTLNSTGGNCNLPALPSTGSYTLRITPPTVSSANLTLTLSSDTAATLAANATATSFSTTRVGQNARYTFSATAGQNGSLLWSGTTFAGNYTYITIFKPDGSALQSQYIDSVSYPSGTLTFNNLQQSGTYSVFVDPYLASTGAVNLQFKTTGTSTPATETVNGTLSVDGSALPVTVPAGQTYNYTFSATQGQQLGLGISALSTQPTGGYASVSVISQDNATVLMNCSTYSAPGSCNLPPMPGAGTYTVRVASAPSSATSLTLTLSTDAAATLTANAAATPFSTTRVGQNARYTFSGTTGQDANLLWSGSTFVGSYSYMTIYNPDGTTLASQYTDSVSYPSGTVLLNNLPQTGTYTVFFDPYGASVGSINVQLLNNAPSTLVVDGAVLPVTLQAGQRGDITFNGTVGQQLGLGLSTVTTSPSGGTITAQLIAPDYVTSLTMTCSIASSGGNCNLPTLPSTGTYTIRLTPPSTSSASLSLTLSSDASGALTSGAAATQFNTTRVGQNARYTFNATAGQNASLLWSGSTFVGAYSYVTIYNPDGTTLASQYTNSTSYPGGTVPLNNLQQSGTYTVFFDPYQANTGSMSLQYQANTPGSLAVDGALLPVTLQAGQRGDFSFSGTTGQHLGLGITALSTLPAGGNVNVVVIEPDTATVLVNCNTYTSTGGNCNLPALPATGTYIVRLTPSGTSSASLSLTLSNDAVATLSANAAATSFSTARVGQNARYTFSATAGQNISLTWSGSTFAGTWSYITIYNPDGTQLSSQYFNEAGMANGAITLSNLQQSGSYTVFVDPYQTSTGTVSLQYQADAPGTLAVDGAALAVTLQAGQLGDFTFSGTVGQHLGVGISALSTSPSGGNVNVSVISPDNTSVLINCSTFAAAGGNCNLPTLPSTGTYTVRVAPSGISAANLTLTLSSDMAGQLAASASATQFNTSRVGQNARYTFTATSGSSGSLIWSGSTFAGYWSYINVLNPDGTTLVSQNFADSSTGTSSGKIILNKLQQAGTYTVFVDPYGASTGLVNVQLFNDATGALPVDGAALPVTLQTGQSGDYTFSGTAGQNLGLGLSSVSTSPAGGTVSVSLIAPDSATVLTVSCSLTSTGGSCNLPALPSTGTYTLHVAPPTTASASLTLTLSSDTAGSLTANAAATQFTTSRVGQNARYTFSAAAGQNVSLVWSGDTFVGTYSTITVLNPDGTTLSSQVFADSATGLSSGTVVLNGLQQTGTYTVIVDPFQASTGAVNLQLLTNASASAAIDSSTLALTLQSGQRGDYTFSGNVGQHLGLGISALSVTPTGGSVSVSVIAPDHSTTFFSCGTFSGTGGSCNLPTLPSTGTYTVRVTPSGVASASVSVTVSSDVTSNVPVNGAAVVFNTNRVGQNARYSFTGTQGGYYTLTWSGATIPGSSTIHVLDPNGVELTSTAFTPGTGVTGTLKFGDLPSDGNYTIFIDPLADGVGQVSVQLAGILPKVATATSGDDADAPLPPWALLVTGGSLLGTALQRVRRRKHSPTVH